MSDTSKHARFYIDTITFRVDDCLFKVPREPFETESTAFKDMFLLPADQVHEEGKSDENPIHLTGISEDEFEQLLRVLFHRPCGMREKSLPETIDQWTSVLKLANLWGFDNIRQAAVVHLKNRVTAVEKVALGEIFDLDFESWSLPAMHEIVRRDQPINFREGQRMGLAMALKFASVRERVSYRNVHVSNLTLGYRPNVQTLDFTPILRETFKSKST